MFTPTTHPTDLFPIPTSMPGAQPPAPEATTALRSVLRDNHAWWYIFHNDRGFHNHIAHRALAPWALNASDERIREAHTSDSAFQRPLHASPAPIMEGNVFEEHLGDRQYYSAYLSFFESALREQRFAVVIERCGFARGGEGKGISMLDRFWAAVHDDSVCAGIPDAFFSLGELAGSQGKGVHVFTVLARVLHDPDLQTIGDTSEEGMYGWTMRNHGASIMRHMADWRVDGTDLVEVERKVEELCWGNTVLFGVGGCGEREVIADFFPMHLVALSLFLRSYIKHLTPPSQYVARGRPAIDITRFYTTTSCPSSSIHEWPALLASSTLHPDDHLPKLQRAL
ncbi:hypothetical protein DXG01_012732 [Tephrocybe rancida]|nr:hypothetical protein DXG01_012732 [Tephrocybe rancida]